MDGMQIIHAKDNMWHYPAAMMPSHGDYVVVIRNNMVDRAAWMYWYPDDREFGVWRRFDSVNSEFYGEYLTDTIQMWRPWPSPPLYAKKVVDGEVVSV